MYSMSAFTHTEFLLFQFNELNKQNSDFHGENILGMFLTNIKNILKCCHSYLLEGF